MPRGEGGARRRALSLAIALVAACGGAQVAPAPSSASCPDVAAHLVELSLADNAAPTGPADLDGAEKEFVRQCDETPWSPERRACLLAASDQEATLQCPRE